MFFITVAAMLINQTGCQVFDRFRYRAESNTPVAFEQAPSKQELLGFLNSRSESVSQIQSDVKVSIAGMPALRGNLAVQRPRNLRLTAGLLGVSELGIDVGSNDEKFWFWTKVAAPGQEPGIFFARHDDYQSSELHQTIPIDPGWIIDSLGFLNFDTNDRIEGPIRRADGMLEIHTYRSIAGQPTIRKTVVDPKYGWIMQQAVYDQTGRLVAYSNSIKQEYYDEYGVSLPGRIEITAFDPFGNPLKLAIDISRYRINSIFGDVNKLWAMPNPGDVPLIDLAKNVIPAVAASSSSTTRDIGDHRATSTYRRLSKSLVTKIR